MILNLNLTYLKNKSTHVDAQMSLTNLHHMKLVQLSKIKTFFFFFNSMCCKSSKKMDELGEYDIIS